MPCSLYIPSRLIAYLYHQAVQLLGSTAEYLTEDDVAKRLKVSVQTLRNWRHLGKGLPYFKIGRAVRYGAEDVNRYLESIKVQPRN